MKRLLDAERSSGEADRLRQRIAALDRNIEQGHKNLTAIPLDIVPGFAAQMRALESERGKLLAHLNELGGDGKTKAVFAEARAQLWRLRDALQGDDLEAQETVLREVVSKIEVSFTHEQTSGRRSPAGKGRTLSRPTGLTLYIRPGLGILPLVNLDLAKSGSRRCTRPCQ